MPKGVGGRLIATAAFLCPIALGLLFMGVTEAPTHYLVTNAVGAMLVCLAIAFAPNFSLGRPALIVMACLAIALLAATFVGPDIGAVHRWIVLGPIGLHSGSLVLPLLAVILPRLEGHLVFCIIAVVAAIVALQPDLASSLAICAIAFIASVYARTAWSLAAFAVTIAALAVAMVFPNGLEPIRFVEGVIADATALSPLLSLAMCGSIAAFAFVGARGSNSWSCHGLAWSACLLAYFLASLIGSYPTPLLGYGISPILGFGLALVLAGKVSGEDQPKA
jgi:hypothetical protein